MQRQESLDKTLMFREIQGDKRGADQRQSSQIPSQKIQTDAYKITKKDLEAK